MLVGQKIKKLRELRNLTQEYMSEKLGMTQSGYSKIESGEVDIPFTKLEQISKVLDMKPEDIISFNEHMIFNVMYNTPGKDLVVYQVSNVEKEEQIKLLKEEITYLKSVLDKVLLGEKKK